MGKRNFSKKIIDWYLTSHRDLPWRRTKDPYFIWLSEVILQQTRVSQGLPYYENFIRDFPTVKALAKASEQKVLRAWQGLGYYTRARNLHACAKTVASTHNGKFPETYEELLSLPGIGPYTAAAISSLAFDIPKAVVDGNVFRVLSRIFGIENDINTTEARAIFDRKANDLLDRNQPGLFNQAVMEFGALHCTPKTPNCPDCIFSSACIARKNGMQHLLPVKISKVKTRIRYFTYFILHEEKKFAMRKRIEKDIWHGLYDFYLVESNRHRKVEGLINEDNLLKKVSRHSTIQIESKRVKHILTHQKINARFVFLNLLKGFKSNGLLKGVNLKLYTGQQMKLLPKPTLISRFLQEKGILE